MKAHIEMAAIDLAIITVADGLLHDSADNQPLGVVTGIVGQNRLRVTVTGEAGHAGRQIGDRADTEQDREVENPVPRSRPRLERLKPF